MQLTAQGGNMVCDFYPVKYSDGTISTRHMLKIVTFAGGQVSKRYISPKEFKQEVEQRIVAHNYEVTDMHVIPQLFNSAMAPCC